MQTQISVPRVPVHLRAGDLVEVLSQEEILATLDEHGEYESLQFMPEMLQYCGQRLRVYKSAHKTCDTLTSTGMRRIDNAVHLQGVRCDGGGHGGCEAACMTFWKTAWLRKVADGEPPARTTGPEAPEDARLLPLITLNARGPKFEDGAERFRCQATELLRSAPEVLPLLRLGQFVTDVRTGNAGVAWTMRAVGAGFYNRFQGLSVKVLPRWARLRGGRHWGFLKGRAVGKTPEVNKGLQPGDLVRVLSRKEIEPTLNEKLLNRGMGFDAEMARHCGRTARIARRIDHIIDENTGRMIYMKSSCLVLENLICEGAFNANCPRAITPYWREAWLEKVEEGAGRG
ncbi:hypothetical protein ABT297_30865 [Dactylosporangium sp. NPDC000555]|uniref:hypothetical protein n=1 Tax=Dactylosporangium sp. NPDC000555 TaxID=3154260 RepID=UPI00331FADD7